MVTLNHINVGITGCSLAVALFLSTLFNNKKYHMHLKEIIMFFGLSILFILLSLYKIRLSPTAKNLSRSIEIKLGFVQLSILFIILGVYYAWTKV